MDRHRPSLLARRALARLLDGAWHRLDGRTLRSLLQAGVPVEVDHRYRRPSVRLAPGPLPLTCH